MNKYAFISMDVESFYDTSCIKKRNIASIDEYDCSNMVKEFINFLNERNIKATFFVTVDFLPRVKNYLLDAIKSGHEIALHSYHHINVINQKDEEFITDFIRAKNELEKELNINVYGNRFPCFKKEEKHLEIIQNNGAMFDSGRLINKNEYEKVNDVIYKKDDFYEFTLVRTPVAKINISGGAFLRLLPWPFAYSKVKRYIKKHNGYTFYLHPFEIFKGELPKIKGLNFLEKMFINHGRDIYLSKIDKIFNLLKDEGYSFLTMSEYIANNK